MAKTQKLKACGRGRLTGALKWTENLAGKRRVIRKAPPPGHLVRNVNWVCGGSLERIKILKVEPPPARGEPPKVGSKVWTLAKLPSASMLRMHCDRCVGPHRPSNNACSATLGLQASPMDEPGAMYDFQTGAKLEHTWSVVSESALPRAKVITRVYERTR